MPFFTINYFSMNHLLTKVCLVAKFHYQNSF
nr:MAG TPA: hypothetical protein [Caudoviricetes sp.]